VANGPNIFQMLLVVLVSVSSVLAKRLAGKRVSDMTRTIVSSGTLNLDLTRAIIQSITISRNCHSSDFLCKRIKSSKISVMHKKSSSLHIFARICDKYSETIHK